MNRFYWGKFYSRNLGYFHFSSEDLKGGMPRKVLRDTNNNYIFVDNKENLLVTYYSPKVWDPF